MLDISYQWVSKDIQGPEGHDLLLRKSGPKLRRASATPRLKYILIVW